MMHDTCFISPHPDDIAYCCCGIMEKPGPHLNSCLITVFGQSIWAPNNNDTSRDVGRISQVRAQEDRRFADRYGLDYLNLNFPDSSVRGYTNANQYATTPENDPLYPAVEKKISEVFTGLTCKTLVAPLCVGNHIDHRMVQAAVLKCQRQFPNIVFYEDIPYASLVSLDEIRQAAHKINKKIVSRDIDITDFLEKKIANVNIYCSQLESHTIGRIIRHASRLREEKGCGERLWIYKGALEA